MGTRSTLPGTGDWISDLDRSYERHAKNGTSEFKTAAALAEAIAGGCGDRATENLTKVFLTPPPPPDKRRHSLSDWYTAFNQVVCGGERGAGYYRAVPHEESSRYTDALLGVLKLTGDLESGLASLHNGRTGTRAQDRAAAVADAGARYLLGLTDLAPCMEKRPGDPMDGNFKTGVAYLLTAAQRHDNLFDPEALKGLGDAFREACALPRHRLSEQILRVAKPFRESLAAGMAKERPGRGG